MNKYIGEKRPFYSNRISMYAVAMMLFCGIFFGQQLTMMAWAQSGNCQLPNLLFVIDKSGSMVHDNKWDDAKQGINTNTQTHANNLRFGLISFSDTASLDAPIPSGSADIEKALNAITPHGNTFMIPAIQLARDHLIASLKADPVSGRQSSIIFITDGAPSDSCPIQEVNALRSLQVNNVTYDIKTYVIGFGTQVNPICLNNLATAGGTARPGSVNYYVASNQGDFSAAVDAISQNSSNEICNGIDDDCDGFIDNIKGTNTPLSQTCKKGLCFGMQICQNGQWAECQPNPPAKPEQCNGQDDDCDGYIDNNPGVQKDYSLTRVCETICGKGTEYCINGAWRNCSSAPKTEICNGTDDDCDGLIDNEPGTKNPLRRSCTQGRCAGWELCQAGQWSTCQPDPPPTAEICNGKDDDCDGYIDNAPGSKQNETLTRPCKNDCGDGIETCISGTWRDCTAPKPATEQCNGKDDDCDGRVDNVKGTANPISRSCTVGHCAGTQLCLNASWGACQPLSPPTEEICNGKDDDCDGYIDNATGTKQNNTLTRPCKTACGEGTETCLNGAWRNCTSAPQTEVCNGKDDDCDGHVDNQPGTTKPLSRSCSVGRCNGTQLCISGSWNTCEPSVAPVEEICNGQDDDCDGYIDNAKGTKQNNTLTRTCKTACGEGTETCISGQWSNCTAAPQTEVCNGKDDDCDGHVDNQPGTTKPLSRSCSVKSCSGVQLCINGTWASCQPNPPPSEEICNGKDDDCDGYIDNAKGTSQNYTLTRECVTACGKGTEVCINGAWRNCTAAPQTEVCNGKDDDCDGQIDNVKGNNQPLTRYCMTGGCEGTQPCINGIWGLCKATPKSTPEICNGIDDDCDGYIDNKPGDKQHGTLERSCATACGKGTEHCIGGKWVNCTAPPVLPERCNGKDDNCDGVIDGPWQPLLGKTCRNICGEGVYKCRADGSDVECVAPQQMPEICDGKDNDCNSLVDELWPELGQLCVAGSGACQKTGVYVCKADGSGSECSAKAPHQPEPEICDGIDNDCDGYVDNVKGATKPLTRPCSAPCGQGIETCQEGVWSECSGGYGTGNPEPEICDGKDNDCDGLVDNEPSTTKPLTRPCSTTCGKGIEKCITGKWQDCNAPQPTPEVCDGKDNDCNGLIDDGLTRPCITACGKGIEKCANGQWLDCNAPQPTPEICDGLDNDCNGLIDDGLTQPCKTECGPGMEICNAGKWMFCDAPQPELEICDGKDNDCNGLIDDGIKPKPCQGACGEGVAHCVNGKWTGCSGPQPEPEICDGKDNDCDGIIDNIQRRCRTACGEGIENCVDGRWLGCLAPYPEPEICDGIDNDCNGKIDDDAPCPEGYRCVLAACRPVCRGGECPAGQRCIDGICIGVQSCQGIICPPGTTCKEDKCVDACDEITCPPDQVCRDGKCYEKSCYAYGCPIGKICVNGECVDDPCADVQCPADQYCKEGQCIDVCPAQCPPGQTCIDGRCQGDPCADVQCPPGQRCENGKCLADNCKDVGCPPSRICVDGKCVHDPCHNIKCPPGSQCLNGQCVGKKPPIPDEPKPEITPEPPPASPDDAPLHYERTIPDAHEIAITDKISGDTASHNTDLNTEVPAGCACHSASLPIFGLPLWLIIFALFTSRYRRRNSL
jgi:uncharacterized protein YegL